MSFNWKFDEQKKKKKWHSTHACLHWISALIEDNFPRCPPKALDLEFRKHRIMEEILRFKPTVICLQEVDQFTFLSEALKKYGYHGMFKPKPSSPCLDNLVNYGPDGCAVFFDLSALELVKCDEIVLKAWGRKTNQVAVICHFQTKSKIAKDFTVAVTHLKAGYQASSSCEDIRKEQAIFLSNYLKDNHSEFPMILCGDLNFPTSEKGYEVIRTCDLGLSSAYTSLSSDGREPSYTFWTITDMELCKTIDYVWYTKKGLKVKTLLNVASTEEVGKDRLPSLKYPSDHISLVCDFELEKIKHSACECFW